ncbi:MAG: peptidylprolyl isomerase [Magnetospirillum sp.]|nr:peptidylprolyl isomerase [Magnetospirillum sp.]
MLARAAVVLTALFTLCLTAGRVPAQEVDRIAAVVNDDIISVRDLDARLKLAIVISGLPDNVENRRRAVPQVLRKMVDERLQTQEANRLKVTVGAEELARSIANIENQNRMPPGGLLASLSKAGVDPDAVKEQVRGDIIWVKLIMRTLQPTIRVGEDEITERIENFKQQMGQPEYMLAEIFLPVESARQEEEARRLGERLQEQLRAGAPFQALARQFSQSASASNGGVLGWVNATTMDEDIKEPVMRMEKGQVSPLIRTGAGYAILALMDKRQVGSASVGEPILSLSQVFFPIPTGNAPPMGQLMAKAAELTAPLKSCRDMDELGRKLHSERSGTKDNLPLSILPQDLRNLVTGLPINKASAPQNTGDALLVVMVCSRETGAASGGGLPSRDNVRRSIEDERLDLMARRYLRDLRRAAFVDFKL